jgi:membrane-associated phospholipid phosphatase
MSVTTLQACRRSNYLTGWLSFAVQVIIAISFEITDDLARGHFAQRGTLQGISNARELATFEASHGFFVEPAWQTFFLHSRHIFILSVSWIDVAHLMNFIYIGGHVGVTLGVAIWVYAYHRRWFALLRNTVILTNAFALLVYENFPVAPPRLLGSLDFDGHPFHFQDTVFGVMNSGGHIIGSQTGFNEFSAMPSVHIAWAMIAGCTILLLARSPWLKAFGAVYPFLMLLSVVVTGNHYLLDAVGSAAVVLAATLTALCWERYSRMVPGPWKRANSPLGAGSLS